MALSDGDGASNDEMSSSPPDDLAEWLPPQVRRNERQPAPHGAVAKGYLDYTRGRARGRPRVPVTGFGHYDPLAASMSAMSVSSGESGSLEASPAFTRRFGAVTLEARESHMGHSAAAPEVFAAKSPTQAATFHTLPPEIRYLVFKEVLCVKEVELPILAVDIPTFERVHPTFVNVSQQRRGDKKDSVLNLLEVCRTFYYEAAPMFYEVNLLRVSSPAMLYSFLNDLPKSRRQHIRRLRIGGIGFHYSGWQLATKAFSMLKLCYRLEHLELELAWGHVKFSTGFALAMWYTAMEERLVLPSNNDDNAREPMFQAVQDSTICLKALRGLRSIQFQMVGSENPLLRGADAESSDPEILDKMMTAASLWAVRIRSIVTQ